MTRSLSLLRRHKIGRNGKVPFLCFIWRGTLGNLGLGGIARSLFFISIGEEHLETSDGKIGFQHGFLLHRMKTNTESEPTTEKKTWLPDYEL